MSIRRVFIVLVLVLLAGAVVVWGASYANKQKNGEGTQVIDGPKQEAPKGELTASFPTELVLDKNAKVESSYNQEVGDNKQTLQSTTTFTSTKSLNDAYNEYLNYAKDKGYVVVNQSLATILGNFYSIGTESDMSVVVLKKYGSNEVEISVTYLAKNQN